MLLYRVLKNYLLYFFQPFIAIGVSGFLVNVLLHVALVREPITGQSVLMKQMEDRAVANLRKLKNV